jgi:hypothetical protein
MTMFRKLIVCLALCAPCVAQTGPPGIMEFATLFIGSSMTAATTYYLPGYISSGLTTSSVNNAPWAALNTGTLKNFAVNTSQILAGNSVVFTVNVNGTATSITCTMGPTGATPGTCSDYTHNAAVNQGDLVSITAVCSGTCSGTTIGAIFAEIATGNTGYMQWQTTVVQQTLNVGQLYNIQPSSSTAAAVSTTLGALMNAPAIQTGHLTQLIVGANTAITFPAGNTITATIYVNGVATALTCNTTSSNQRCMDVADSVAVNQGDKIQATLQCAGTCGSLQPSFSVQLGMTP